jgi:hypothetical protein
MNFKFAIYCSNAREQLCRLPLVYFYVELAAIDRDLCLDKTQETCMLQCGIES